MSNLHLYLFALEVEPMKVEGAYDQLPLHCTLMPRFWSDLTPLEMIKKVQNLLDNTAPIRLVIGKHKLLGPKLTSVNLIELSNQLNTLHIKLKDILDGIGVEYTSSEWVGEGYVPHISNVHKLEYDPGNNLLAAAVYLIEVGTISKKHQRFIHAKIELRKVI